MNKLPAYVSISLVITLIIGVAFGYSYFFYPNDHPIDCIIKQKTGKDCPSCGLSRAFSSFTHFHIQEGQAFNPHAWNIFMFMLVQLLWRGAVLVIYFVKKKTPGKRGILADILISISAFLFAFLPLIPLH